MNPWKLNLNHIGSKYYASILNQGSIFVEFTYWYVTPVLWLMYIPIWFIRYFFFKLHTRMHYMRVLQLSHYFLTLTLLITFTSLFLIVCLLFYLKVLKCSQGVNIFLLSQGFTFLKSIHSELISPMNYHANFETVTW